MPTFLKRKLKHWLQNTQPYIEKNDFEAYYTATIFFIKSVHPYYDIQSFLPVKQAKEKFWNVQVMKNALMTELMPALECKCDTELSKRMENIEQMFSID